MESNLRITNTLSVQLCGVFTMWPVNEFKMASALASSRIIKESIRGVTAPQPTTKCLRPPLEGPASEGLVLTVWVCVGCCHIGSKKTTNHLFSVHQHLHPIINTSIYLSLHSSSPDHPSVRPSTHRLIQPASIKSNSYENNRALHGSSWGRISVTHTHTPVSDQPELIAWYLVYSGTVQHNIWLIMQGGRTFILKG